MAYAKMRCMYIFLLVLGALCLYVSVYNLTPFKEELFVFKKESGNFLQLPEIDCRENPPFLVLLVTSSHRQAAARMAIRQTWGREMVVKGKQIKTFFLLGITTKDQEMTAVAQEGQQYGDIIQKDFVDVYFNLTLKTMMGIEWVHHYCPEAAFVMKTDCDMFVNVYYLTELLLKKNRTTRFFTGFLKMNEFPIRKKFNKWFVSKFEYPWDKYPPFCSGTGYVFSGDVASQVYDVSESVPFIKLEDVFVGLCLEKLNIKLEELHSEQTFFPEGLHFSTCRFKKIVTCHFIKPPEMLTYWQALESSPREECSVF
ncbi:beta-1,3-galactosyltransferase 5 isoform X1 [Elephas maximus indicus]|uniref:beta-1,3-galactosyltransferase 5 isoform X1 n=1 Tax=Elephas maximus indicus TaxID=99487 RepID=UPI00211699F1|nr:beta-1,3-galactosyltransferase 5 isoform X1 [Elephas maximus indicus]XP_049730822.1 beta-1,3-galactosyltransferase 5 isoform X1 [Elephas maximus indicus]XP_049730823.1 beta-1,3-galactosyltransferase 5 isoform X1 [Elephas maximus indicus]XP_049730824.1 beta-1,3-galactosyltransferase 5 isoform X1 [Elephas maximus indicus]XP_049730826.1 beta-1,3-galactosyltransferase 5 isoform X1 [Elephas maximus indicus]XP_049730827.1 beta-1,3-galactosyltransferase 5 isoform X1 [Elephas maximus indicus]XP_04